MDADVVVIGAGAAGLAAALSLARRSLRVIVLEARDREGGRVWSDPAARTRVPAELGAEFIHGPAKKTLALLRDAGMAAIDTGGESWARGEAGALRRVDDDDFLAAADIFEGVRALASDDFDGLIEIKTVSLEIARAKVPHIQITLDAGRRLEGTRTEKSAVERIEAERLIAAAAQ